MNIIRAESLPIKKAFYLLMNYLDVDFVVITQPKQERVRIEPKAKQEEENDADI